VCGIETRSATWRRGMTASETTLRMPKRAGGARQQPREPLVAPGPRRGTVRKAVEDHRRRHRQNVSRQMRVERWSGGAPWQRPRVARMHSWYYPCYYGNTILFMSRVRYFMLKYQVWRAERNHRGEGRAFGVGPSATLHLSNLFVVLSACILSSRPPHAV
jgi:hypothetical protein